MLADILTEVATPILRFIGRITADIFISFFFEVTIQGTGYAISRPFKPDVEPDGRISTAVGLTFWLFIAALSYIVWERYS